MAPSTSQSITFQGLSYELETVIKLFETNVTAERSHRIREVIEGRSRSVVTVLEDLYDRGNASAVMRSAEAMGFLDLHMIEKSEHFKKANRVTKGADKWLNITRWKNTTDCVLDLKRKGYKIYVTHLEGALPIQELDFSQPCAIVLGNERSGVSEEMVSLADNCFIVPMAGFVQSFNISVAAALCLYHAHHQRNEIYGKSGDLTAEEKRELYAEYLVRAHLHPEQLLQQIDSI